mgnify:FL=1
MLKIIANISLILNLIHEYVAWAEQSYEDGEDKRNAVLNAVIETAKSFGINLEPYKSIVLAIIDSIVAFNNILGIFTHRQ